MDADVNVAVLLRERENHCVTRKHARCRSLLHLHAERVMLAGSFQHKEFKIPPLSKSTYLAVISPDGASVASAHGDHHVYICELNTLRLLHCLKGHCRTPWAITFHPSRSDLLASGCLAGDVRVWDLKTGCCAVYHNPASSSIASLAFHPTRRLLAIATADQVLFWDWTDERPSGVVRAGSARERVRYVSFDQSGSHLFTGINNVGDRTQPSARHARPPPVMPYRCRELLENRQNLINMRSDLSRRHGAILERHRNLIAQYQNLLERSRSIGIELNQEEEPMQVADPANEESNILEEVEVDLSVEERRYAELQAAVERTPTRTRSSVLEGTSEIQLPADPASTQRDLTTFPVQIPLEDEHDNPNPALPPVPDSSTHPRLGSSAPPGPVTLSARDLADASSEDFAATISRLRARLVEIGREVEREEARIVGQDEEARAVVERAMGSPNTRRGSRETPPLITAAWQRLRNLSARLDRVDQAYLEQQNVVTAEDSSATGTAAGGRPDPPLSPIALEGLQNALDYARDITQTSIEQFMQQHAHSVERIQRSYVDLSVSAQELMRSFQGTYSDMCRLQDRIEQALRNQPQAAADPDQPGPSNRTPARSSALRDPCQHLLTALAHLQDLLLSRRSAESLHRQPGASDEDVSTQLAALRAEAGTVVLAYESLAQSVEECRAQEGRSQTSQQQQQSFPPDMETSLERGQVRVRDLEMRLSAMDDSATTSLLGETRQQLMQEVRRLQLLVRRWKHFVLASMRRLAMDSITPPSSSNVPARRRNAESPTGQPPWKLRRVELPTPPRQQEAQQRESTSDDDTPSSSGTVQPLTVQSPTHIDGVHQASAITRYETVFFPSGDGEYLVDYHRTSPTTSPPTSRAYHFRGGPRRGGLVSSTRSPPSELQSPSWRSRNILSATERNRYVPYHRRNNVRDRDGPTPTARRGLRPYVSMLEIDDNVDTFGRSYYHGRVFSFLNADSAAEDRPTTSRAARTSAYRGARDRDRAGQAEAPRSTGPTGSAGAAHEVDDEQSSIDLHRLVSRAIAGAFISSGDMAVANNILDLTTRIQRWSFHDIAQLDISDARANVVLSHCKLHNDGSVSISPDGSLLAAFVDPSGIASEDDAVWADTQLQVVALDDARYGTVLYTKTFGPNAISVSFSPTQQHLLVGLASRRYQRITNNAQIIAQVYRLRPASNNFLDLTTHIDHSPSDRDTAQVNTDFPGLEPLPSRHSGLNCALWNPVPGGGIVYGSNKGALYLVQSTSLPDSLVDEMDTFRRYLRSTSAVGLQSRLRARLQRSGARMNLHADAGRDEGSQGGRIDID